MGFVGRKPTNAPLTSSDLGTGIVGSTNIADGTIANADIANSTIDLTAKVTGTLPTTKGGTGLAALGTVGQALVVNSGATALEFATVGATAGQVIQVLSATDSTQRSTSSTSFVTASNTLSVTITPSATANKIFIIASIALSESSGNDTFISIFRGATNLGNATSGFTSAPNSMITPSVIIAFLDSPSTTSSTTYQVYLKCESGGSINLNQSTRGTRVSTITCMEIKG